MGYKVGDKIKIREWDDMEKEFGLNRNGNIDCRCYFTKNMKQYCGKTLEVSEIALGGNYFVKGNFYTFSDDMIVKENKMKEWKMRIKTQKELNMVVDELIKRKIKWYSEDMVDVSDKNCELPICLYLWKEEYKKEATLAKSEYDCDWFKAQNYPEITPQEFCKAHKQIIVIYRDGNSVIAKDKETGKKAVAKCHPDDEFDFMVGAKLALERLSQPDEPKYYNGKVVCVKSLMSSLTVGKIYNVKDGQFKDDYGNWLPSKQKLKSFSDFDERFASSFIEIVE